MRCRAAPEPPTSPERLPPAVLRCSIGEACFQGVSRGSARRGAWFSICFTSISENDYSPPQSTGKGSAGERHDQRRRKAGERIGGDGVAGPQRSRERGRGRAQRSEEHTSELQSLMRISYAVFCLKKKKTKRDTQVT